MYRVVMRESPRIFLSYSQSDARQAETLAQRLAEVGMYPHLSRSIFGPGKEIIGALRSHLEASDYMLLLLSPEALSSQWVQYELEYAVEKDWHQRAINVIPVKVRPCKTPSYLDSSIVIDATRDFDKGARRVAELLKNIPLVQFERMNGLDFEGFVIDFLKSYGFKSIIRPRSHGEFQHNLTARSRAKDPFGRSFTVEWIVETKASRHISDVGYLRHFLEAVSFRRVQGLYITTGQLTTPAKQLLEESESFKGPKIFVLEGTDIRRLTLAKPRLVNKYFAPE